MCLRGAAARGAPGPTASSVPGHLEVVLLFADGSHGGHGLRFPGVLLHHLLPAEAEHQAACRAPPPPTGCRGPEEPAQVGTRLKNEMLQQQPARVFLTVGSCYAGRAVLPATRTAGTPTPHWHPAGPGGNSLRLRPLPGTVPHLPMDPDSRIRKDPKPSPGSSIPF